MSVPQDTTETEKPKEVPKEVTEPEKPKEEEKKNEMVVVTSEFLPPQVDPNPK